MLTNIMHSVFSFNLFSSGSDPGLDDEYIDHHLINRIRSVGVNFKMAIVPI